MSDILVPHELREFAAEYKAGWAYGQTCKKGQKRHPYFSLDRRRRGFAWVAGREDAMHARGLFKNITWRKRLTKTLKTNGRAP